MQNRERVIIALVIVLLLGGALWRGLEHKRSIDHRSGAGAYLVEEGSSPGREPAEKVEPELKLLTVHIVGAVARPGVYQLVEGARVFELIELCGGFSEEAEGELINQARPLFDGEQIFVPRKGESAPAGTESAQGLININTASADQLTALPGIGEVKARQIVAHREANGPFREPGELADVSGIGEKTLQNIADLITVY